MTERLPLTIVRAMELVPRAPFNFDATMHKPAHFPSRDNEWQPGVRWQTMLWQGERLGLKLENRGTVGRPRVALSVWSARELPEAYVARLVEEIRYRYNLEMDLREFNKRFADDAQLGPIIDRWRGMRPLSYDSLYEYLVIAIILQNATVRRSVSMMQALFERYGTLLSYDGKELYCFWPPESLDDVSETDLRALKVGYRARSIKRVTAAFARGEIDEIKLRSRTGDEQRSALLGLYGIGPGFGRLHPFRRLPSLGRADPHLTLGAADLLEAVLRCRPRQSRAHRSAPRAFRATFR